MSTQANQDLMDTCVESILIPAMEPSKAFDPILQMLTSRAATDPSLRELVDQATTSRASPAQLQVFQSCIDDINVAIETAKARNLELSNMLSPSEAPSNNTNSPTSILLRLPVEIRKIMWEYSLTPQKIWFCEGADRDHTKYQHPVCFRRPGELKPIALFLVCRQIQVDLADMGSKIDLLDNEYHFITARCHAHYSKCQKHGHLPRLRRVIIHKEGTDQNDVNCEKVYPCRDAPFRSTATPWIGVNGCQGRCEMDNWMRDQMSLL